DDRQGVRRGRELGLAGGYSRAAVKAPLAPGQRKGENGGMNLRLGFPEEMTLTRQPNLEAALAHFRALMQKDNSPIRAIRHQPARAAEYAEIPASVHPKLRAGLERRNIPKLYSHQADAFEIVNSGRNVVVVTPTASGK